MIDESWYVRPAQVSRERISAGGVVVRAHAGEPLVALARERSYQAQDQLDDMFWPDQRKLVQAHAELIRRHV
jgi:hypothetical protein